MTTDLLILTIYLICVAYVIYQMALSVEAKLEDQVEIILDRQILRDAIAAQLQQQGTDGITIDVPDTGPAPLARTPCLVLTVPPGFVQEGSVGGTVAVQVSPQGARALRPPIPGLTVQIVNMVPATQVLVDWDSSTLNLYNNQARRVIRQIPGMMMDLIQPQIYSAINPRQSFNATVTTEDVFGRHPETQLLQPVAPLLNLEKVVTMPAPLRTYALELMVGIRFMTSAEQPVMRLIMPFRFEITVLPDKIAIPLFRWIVNTRS